MIIDEEIISGGVTPFIITKLIERHERESQRYRLLHDYYMGDHRILSRRKRGKNVANNRIMCNHAKYITDMTQSYLVGNPVILRQSKTNIWNRTFQVWTVRL